jgi:hypothetical protein
MSIIVIDIYPNRVIIENDIELARPKRISPSQWMEFWEDMQMDYYDESALDKKKKGT